MYYVLLQACTSSECLMPYVFIESSQIVSLTDVGESALFDLRFGSWLRALLEIS